jgi:structural maintenance of chromosome 2
VCIQITSPDEADCIGFKSYPVRTTITGKLMSSKYLSEADDIGFDESFNAITGLNGSGKSNILDAICFVLGITNMTSVRANNLMDLIYKRYVYCCGEYGG